MLSHLDRYLDLWSLTDPQPLAQTYTSTLFKVKLADRPAVLKLLTAAGEDDERAAAEALAWYAGQGAVELLRADSGAMLLEYAGGPDLTELVRQGKDEDATAIIADLLDKLHLSRPGQPAGLTSLEERFRSLLDSHNSHPSAAAILHRGAKTAAHLLSGQGQRYVLHGDIHHENIRQHSERGWLAIDPKASLENGPMTGQTRSATRSRCHRPFRAMTG